MDVRFAGGDVGTGAMDEIFRRILVHLAAAHEIPAAAHVRGSRTDVRRARAHVRGGRTVVRGRRTDVRRSRTVGVFFSVNVRFSLAGDAALRVKGTPRHLILMAKTYFLPSTDTGVASTLLTFDTAVTANTAALATKWGMTNADINRIRAAHASFQWFLDSPDVVRDWLQGFNDKRGQMFTGPATGLVALPAGPVLPALPTYVTYTGGGAVPPVTAQFDPGFFIWFLDMVQTIKKRANYDPADGQLAGIEGSEKPAPDPSIVPVVTGDLFHSGHPELTCKKGPFQGYSVWLTRPGQPRKELPFSTARRYTVNEPLPAAGTAEIWVFEVQYRYQNAPFGQVSQPMQLVVRG